ncbi:IS3 family transposase [Sulfobacillus thermosulfidooxidans]|uniref:IS3 family transposase n=1 Tax=Sulfobacillus thermosulfidooxidans TaxID=28034 RepID=UPI00178C30F5|nr:IS3 family transposase [Sulfobacillus thermosulfidooxidans]
MAKQKRHSATFKSQVVLEMLKEEKTVSQIAAEYGIHPSQLHRWKRQALENFPQLFTESQALQQQAQAHQQQLTELYAEIGKLTTQVEWLKKNLASTLTRDERMTLLDRGADTLPLTTQAALLSLNRSSLYYRPVGPDAEEIALKHRIDEIYIDRPFYGSRRMTAQLNHEGYAVNRKRVQRTMREMGIWGLAPGPKTSTRHPQHPVYPYLLKGVTPAYPNHVWGIDVTYIRMVHGWLYLVAIMDWYSRFVVAWELSETLELPFVLTAAERALSIASPTIWNHDQGSHFTSPQYTALLLAKEVQISMDSKGRALDNVLTERLWRSVKYEEVYLHDYRSPREARSGLSRYFTFYNYHRLHQSLGYTPPAAWYSPLPSLDRE